MMTSNINILMVEDDRAYARVVQHAIRKARPQCSLFHVTDGDRALEYVYGRGDYADRDRFPLPQLILLDLRMPRMDGFEVLQQLKADVQTCSLPVVVMTSSDLRSDRERCEEYGADLFVTKPVEFAELFELLEQTIPQHTA